MMKQYMTRYFTLLLSILMGVMMIGIDTAMAHHGWEEPNSAAVWFTTLPPAAHTDVADAITNGTLKATTTGLRRNKTYYFNLYVVDAGSSAKFYFADPTNPNGADDNISTTDDNYLSECIINDTSANDLSALPGCASAIMKIFSSDFNLCIISSLLHSLPGNTQVEGAYIYASTNFWRYRVMGCSDADTCEGKVRGGKFDTGELVGLKHVRNGKLGKCWTGTSFKTYGDSSPVSEGIFLGVDSPIYFRFIHSSATDPDLTEILDDFTVSVSVIGVDNP